MNELDFEYNKEYYTKKILESTDSVHSGSWGGCQDFRYLELTTKEFYDGHTVLEIGCGTGGFLEYIESNGFHSDYCGIDIVPEMQIYNERKWPNYKFMTLDVLNSDYSEKYDIVVFCGVFNILTNDPENYMKALLRRGFDLCNYMISFNFISTYVNFTDEHIAYHNPIDIMQFCIEKLSRKVVMNHHYSKCDVSCKVFK